MTPTSRSRRRAFSLIELMIVVAIVGILASLGVYGVKKYVANAKTAEARSSLGQISRDAMTAYETINGRALCASASQPVPASITSVQGKKYQSSQGSKLDWNVDQAARKGFACLLFSIASPQYYLYAYASDGNSAASPVVVGTQFSATANGDLDGDGATSTFTVTGAVRGTNLYVSPSILEVAPDE